MPNAKSQTLFRKCAKESLIRRTTYHEYIARRTEAVPSIGDRVLRKIEERAVWIQTMMLPHDELWEWESGDWDRFAGDSGLAIIRDGEIIQSWIEWKS